jgi:hypothetical protein
MPLFTPELEFSDDYPTIEPSLRLDFANARALDPRITFTRASVATYVGKDGLIKTAGEDEARFDHDPATGESLGLLIEESRTNLFPFNNNPTTNASGTATKSTVQIVLPSGETGPALETDADAFAENYRNLTATANTNPGYLTFYAKKKSAGSTGTLTITMEGGGTARSFNSVSINSDTWTKISTTHDWSSSNATLRRYDIYFNGSGNTSDGDTSFYVAFQQFEEATFPTSYIPTSGSTATRAQDEGNITGSAFSSFFNTTEGVLQTEFSRIGSVNNQMVVQFKDNNASERIEIRGQGSGENSFRMEVIENGATTGQEYTFSSGSPVANVVGQFAKVNLAYKQNDFASTINGTIASTDNSGDVGVCDRAGIGYANYGVRYNGHIKNIIYYPKRLTNTQLQTLTQ